MRKPQRHSGLGGTLLITGAFIGAGVAIAAGTGKFNTAPPKEGGSFSASATPGAPTLSPAERSTLAGLCPKGPGDVVYVKSVSTGEGGTTAKFGNGLVIKETYAGSTDKDAIWQTSHPDVGTFTENHQGHGTLDVLGTKTGAKLAFSFRPEGTRYTCEGSGYGKER